MINLFISRIFRAIKIDIELFEEVEKDKKATFQAGVVVVLSSLAAGVGSIHLGVSNFLIAPALSLLSWYVWAYIIYFVGVKLFGDNKTKSDHGELLRTIGFSSAPGLIRVFGVCLEVELDELFICVRVIVIKPFLDQIVILNDPFEVFPKDRIVDVVLMDGVVTRCDVYTVDPDPVTLPGVFC